MQKVDGKNFQNSCTNEVLQVRAYGQLYIHLGINIRSGRLLLQSSENILLPSVLLESEEALNKGSLTANEVFVNLRIKSILHLFAATGRFLGLKVVIVIYSLYFVSHIYLYSNMLSCVYLSALSLLS